jgi:hypothetical protein
MKEKELKFYADKLLISSKYLSNTVREITNQPPSKFITEALLNNAKILLLIPTTLLKKYPTSLIFLTNTHLANSLRSTQDLAPLISRKRIN